MTRTFASALFALAVAAAAPSRALAANACTNPGKDGPGTSISGIVNSYYPGVTGTAGATTVTVGAVDTSSGGLSTAIGAGDLLLVMQMQDADLSTSNDSGYGGSSPGSGQTALNNSGAYEYVTVAASYAGGATIPLTAPLRNNYRARAYSAANGQRTFQVVRVPQYSSVRFAGLVTAAPWNGATGGVVVIDVAGSLNWNAQVIDVTGRGFRGGGALYMKGVGSGQPTTWLDTDYVTSLTVFPTFSSNPTTQPGPFNGSNASKGEGIAGTPRYLFVPNPLGSAINGNGATLDTGVEGYPNGSMARGAPGNAGGGGTDGDPQTAANGGNDQNTGGGGGGGSAAGGMGGYGWTPGTPPGSMTGGFGGQGVPMTAARLTLGGGGGAGTTNNGTGTPNYGIASSGAAGGGLVLLRAKTITGSGTVNANGAAGNGSVCNDASGGGGGGGAVLVFASGNSGNVGTVTINAAGGGGGSNTGNGTENSGTCGGYNNNPHGPGGGGGGGFVALSSISNATINVAGGANGTTSPSPTSTAPYGSSSSPGGYTINQVQATDLPGAAPSPLCFPLLTVTKATTKAETVQGSTTSYVITVSNAGSYGTATGVTLDDVLPAGFNFASTDAIALSGGATRTATSAPAAGATSLSWGAFSVPGGGAVSVSFTVNVTSAAPLGTAQNSASVVYDDPTRTAAGQTVTPGGTYSTGDFVQGSNYAASSSTAEDVNVRLPATISAGFSPVSVTAGGTSQLSIIVQNPNGVALTAAALTDALPAGLTAAGGAVTVTGSGCSFPATSLGAGATSMRVSGGTVPPNGTCTFTFGVVAGGAQSYTDVVPAGSFTNALNVVNVAPASATLLSRPTIAKSFTPASMSPGGSATLVFTLVNPNAGTALSNASFTDAFPANLTTGSGNITFAGCSGFAPATVSAGGTSLSFSGGALPAGGTCTLSVPVTSSVAGSYSNTASGVTTNETVVPGAPSNAAQFGVGVIGIAESFSPATIASGGTSTLTFTLTNPTGVAQTGGTFSDTLANLTAAGGAVGGTCTGTTPASLTAGTTSLSFTNIRIPAAGCTITLAVTSSVVGTQTDAAGGVRTSSLGMGPGATAASLVVTGPPAISKAFSPALIQTGASSTLTFTVVNNSTVPLTGARFTDTLSGMQLAAAGSAGGTCAGASSLSFTAGQTGLLTFSGLTIPVGAGGCTVTVPVTATAASPAGGYANTASGVSSNEAPTGSGSNTANLVVAAAASITKAFATSPIGQGGTSLLTFTLANPSNIPLTGATFSDTLVNMSVAAAQNAGGTCAGASSIAFSAGQTALAFSGLTLPAAGSCTVTVNVTSNVSGANTNTASGVTANETPVAGAPSNTATLQVYAPAQLSVGFAPGVILSSAASASSFSTLTITLANSNAVPLTNVSFTDALSNMQIYAAGAAGGTCTGAAGNTFAAGATNLTFSGLTVPPNGSCTVTVRVASGAVSPAAGWADSTSGATSAQTPIAGPASAAGYLAVVTYATIAKSFSPASIAATGASTVTFTLTNPNAIALSGVAFSDTFPTSPGPMLTSGAAQNYIGAGRGTCTGAIPSAGSGAATGVSFSGIQIPANASCTVLVDVTAAVAGTYANTASGVTSSQTGAAAGPASNTATLGVGRLGVAKSFSPASIGVGETSTLTVVVSNPNGSASTNVSLVDNFPAGLSIATPLTASTTCGSLKNAGNTAPSAAGDTGFSLQGAKVPANASCTIQIAVTTGGAGSFANTTNAPLSGGTTAGAASNTATLTVVSKPSIAEAFNPATLDTYRNTLLTFTLTNPNAAALTNCTFTDALSGFAVSNPPSIGGTCVGATSTPALSSGATSLNLSVASLPNGSCTVTVPVTSSTAGTYPNAASGLACSQFSTATAAPASAQVTFRKLPLSVQKSANLVTVPPGSAVTYTITYANPNSAQPLQGIVITDATPQFTSFSGASCGPLPASLTSCTISSPAVGATGTVTWTLGGTLDPGATGSVTITVTVK